MRIQRTTNEITSEWLTTALRANDRLGTAEVQAVSVELIGQGRGFAGSIVRLTVRYAGDTDAPSTMVSKLPSIDPEIRRYAVKDGMYRRETMFYRELAQDSTIIVPDCYYAEHDSVTGDFVLLLEDLTDLQEGNEIVGCSLDQARSVVQSLAQLHATWWNSKQLSRHSWLPGTGDSSASFSALQDRYREAWNRAADTLALIFPRSTFAIAERFGRGLASVLQAAATGDQTLNHGDTHLGNLFFRDNEVVFTDWQNVMATSPTLDVAYFIQGSLPVEGRRTHERALLDLYASTLEANGVTNYTSDNLIEDYRRGLLRTLVPSVLSVANLDMDSPETRELVQTIGARMIAIADWDCGDLISG